MKTLIIFVVMLFTLSLFASDYEETKHLSLSAEDISKLTIDCGAGFLKVHGQSGLDEIRVTAVIKIDNIDHEKAERLVERYVELSLVDRGSKAELTSSFENTNSVFSVLFNRNANITIDLTVDLPENIDVVIDDGSGLIEVRDLSGDLSIDDGSGQIDLQNINGKVDIDDGSGDIEIEFVKNNIDIDDGSGDIHIKNVKGDVRIDDGTGDLEVIQIGGTVRVDDGGGSIYIDDVDEDVVIEDAHSGNVRIRNVAGNVHRYDD